MRHVKAWGIGLGILAVFGGVLTAMVLHPVFTFLVIGGLLSVLLVGVAVVFGYAVVDDLL